MGFQAFSIVVKAHMLLVCSGVRDFGPAGPLFRLPQNYLTVCWRGLRLQLQMKMASLTLVGTEGIFCLLTDRMVPCPVLPLWPKKDTQFYLLTQTFAQWHYPEVKPL